MFFLLTCILLFCDIRPPYPPNIEFSSENLLAALNRKESFMVDKIRKQKGRKKVQKNRFLLRAAKEEDAKRRASWWTRSESKKAEKRCKKLAFSVLLVRPASWSRAL